VFFTLFFLSLPAHAGPEDVREPAAKKEEAVEAAVPSRPGDAASPPSSTSDKAAKENEADREDECLETLSRCSDSYDNLMERYKELGCSDAKKPCEDAADSKTCAQIDPKVLTSYNSLPSPVEFVHRNEATCSTPRGKCPIVKEHIAREMLRNFEKCRPQENVARKNGSMEILEEIEITLNSGNRLEKKGGARSGGRMYPENGAVPRNGPSFRDEAVHVLHFLKMGRIDSDYKDCLVKEAKALPKLSPEQREKQGFCAYLYVDPPTSEYGLGPLPPKYSNPIQQGISAGLSRTEIPIKIEFHKRSECKPTILEQEKYYPGVLDYFRPISVDLDEVCNALIKKNSVKTWHFHSGNRSGPTAKPFAFEPQ
jgi:hypothetical protein